jgi:sulfate permease, SulP family
VAKGVDPRETGIRAKVASGLRAELQPSRLIPTLSAGAVIGVLEVVLATSFAALIFGGRGAVHLPEAVGFSLFGAVAVMSVIAVGSSVPGMVGSLQDTTAVLLALLAGTITTQRSLEFGYTEEQTAALSETFLTVVAAIVLASALTGLFFVVLGSYRLGNLVRFVPYPVIGGFLAGTGWLLFKGGMGVLTARSLSLETIEVFGRPQVVLKWLPGVLFALVLVLLARQFRHFLTIPGAVVAGGAVFYVVLWATGAGIEVAEARGWLLGPFPPGGGLFDPALGEAVTHADWGAILGQGLNILTLMVVAVLALLVNASGIELIVDRETDVNRELRVAGLANMVGASGAGIVGFHALSLTALARRTGATSRLVGLVAAAVCLVALAFGARALSLFPRPILGGMVVFLGLSFLVEWVIEAPRRLLRRDYAVVLLILLAVAFLGFLQGVVVGLLMATLLFVVDYSQIDVVKDEIAGSAYRSKVDRGPDQLEILRQEGDRIHVVTLQGIVFFGTAHALLDRIRRRAKDPTRSPLEFLVMDFRRVPTVDSSAVLSFVKVRSLAESLDFALILTGLSETVRRLLLGGGFEAAEPRVRLFSELDRGVEWCEDRLLEARVVPVPTPGEALPTLLQDSLGSSVDPRRLMDYLEVQEIDRGEELIRQGDSSEDLYFLESGRLTAQLRGEDGRTVRLQTMGPGSVVGEVSLYGGTARTASVVSEERSKLYRLTRESLEAMEHGDPELAAAVHRLFARLLASRLADSQQTIRALLD